MAIIGYARVSTDEQVLDLQLNALKAAGCDRIFQDHGVSAVAERRPGFEDAMAMLQSGDTFVVWKNDRAFRSLKDAFFGFEAFQDRQVTYRSLTEHIDTTTATGRAMFYIQMVFAQWEREVIVERTRAGLEAARLAGKILGRRPKLSKETVAAARLYIESGLMTKEEIAFISGVTERTLIRALQLFSQT